MIIDRDRHLGILVFFLFLYPSSMNELQINFYYAHIYAPVHDVSPCQAISYLVLLLPVIGRVCVQPESSSSISAFQGCAFLFLSFKKFSQPYQQNPPTLL